MRPLVSVNISCYNGEKYLEETLQSVFGQTYDNWELIFVDDGSTDSTRQIVHRHIAEGWPIRYHYQENAGLGAARKKAAELSTGKFIAFVDADDLWLPQKLEKQIPLFEDERVGLVHCDTLFFKGHSDVRQLFNRKKPPQGRIFRELLVDYHVSFETVMIRAESLRAMPEGFDPRFYKSPDMDLIVRLAYLYHVAFVDQVLAKWRISEKSMTHTSLAAFPREKELLLEKLQQWVPNFTVDYAREIELLREKIAYQKGIATFMEGKAASARKYLRSIKWRRKKHVLAYLMTFFPSSWASVFEVMYWRFVR
ncbi:MAG: glycosyltransferase family 2 protein [Chloroflexi bacterium]|nr:glycosyltransferase family 2 protein [Chloroflexota bacterium]